MPGQQNNINALKWTEMTVLTYLEKMEEVVLDQKTYYISRMLLDMRLPLRVWSYWREVFADNERITDQMERIDGLVHANLLDAALVGEVASSIAIFILKNNYQGTDRPKIEQRELRPDLNLRYMLTGGEDLTVLPLEELTATLARNSQQRNEA